MYYNPHLSGENGKTCITFKVYMYKYIILSMAIQSMQDSCVFAILFGMGWDELPLHLPFLSASGLFGVLAITSPY